MCSRGSLKGQYAHVVKLETTHITSLLQNQMFEILSSRLWARVLDLLEESQVILNLGSFIRFPRSQQLEGARQL
jgi:hypothetical protein